MEIGSREFVEFNKKKYLNYLAECERPGMSSLIKYLEESTFFIDPASAYYHADHMGGLCFHSNNVIENLLHLNEYFKLGYTRETCILVAALHDLCKVGTYKVEPKWYKGEDTQNKWVNQRQIVNQDSESLLPHGVASAMIASRYIQLSDEEACAISYHMSLFEYDKTNRDFSKAMHTYKLVLATQHADHSAGNFLEVIYPKNKVPFIEDLENAYKAHAEKELIDLTIEI